MKRWRFLEDADNARFEAVIKSCEVVPGLLSRHPSLHQNVHQEHDDITAAITMSHICGGDFARRFLAHGRNGLFQNFIPYNFNNVEPGKFTWVTWIGRYQQVICHAQFAAGETPPWWRKVWWMVAMIKTAIWPDQDGVVLTWMMREVAKGRDPSCDRVIEFWEQKIPEAFPAGIGQVLQAYGWKDHPNTRWLWGKL